MKDVIILLAGDKFMVQIHFREPGFIETNQTKYAFNMMWLKDFSNFEFGKVSTKVKPIEKT